MVVVTQQNFVNSSVIGGRLCYVSIVSIQWLGLFEGHTCVVYIVRLDCDRTPSAKAKSSPSSLPIFAA
jgi:hypothetical protein